MPNRSKLMKQVKKCIMNFARRFWSAAEKKAMERVDFAMERWERYKHVYDSSTSMGQKNMKTPPLS